MKKKRILHVIKGLGRGGAERLLQSTLRLHNQTNHFDVVYFLSIKNHLKDQIEQFGCTVTCLHANNVFQMLLKIPTLIQLVRTNKYDLIHAHLPWAGIISRIVGKMAHVPVVYTEHNVFNRYNVVTRMCSRLTYGWQSKVIAVSDRVAEVLTEIIKSDVPVRVIANAVDVMEFKKDHSIQEIRHPKIVQLAIHETWLGFPEDGIIVGTVGALTAQKRMDRWLRIAKEVVIRHPRVYFVIVGDGVLRKELEDQASQLINQSKVRFVGLTSHPVAWLNCFDIFLMSSAFEGLPVALLEAMSMECVPVVTAVGGIPAVIEQGKNGFMYEPDDIETAVKEIIMLISDEEKRKTIGREARKTVVERYSIERMVGELEEVYEEVLGGREIEK